MSLEVFWRLPANGDGRTHDKSTWTRGDHQGVPARPHAFARIEGGDDRFNYFDHLAQVARAAELSGFDGVVIPQTDEGEEPLIVAGALAREARRIRLAPQLPAHFLSAVYTAKIATSFQRLTGGRLVLNFAVAAPQAGAWHGHDWSEAEQIARLDEFLTVLKGVWGQPPFTFEGRYYEVLNGGFAGPLAGQLLPQIQLSGESPEALDLSARHADVHIFKAASPDAVANRISELRTRAAAQDRAVRFGVEAEPIARHDRKEADAAGAERWPNGAPDPGLVGTFADVADRFAQYHAAGVEVLLLGAHPHLEEAYRIAQNLLPRLPGRAEPLRKTA
ncbi:LLM class flavin-dependent oxidoreductase [Phenylobacterium sp.]|jgi:alkanesulfonate monooxygenase|uniref:LLM class flavin-dependent oxidoreductase n=1 Tax=Phenylobacterium sp. TaxID=1871053 RepID=UPI0037831D33